MSISVLNASIETLRSAYEAIILADYASAKAQHHLGADQSAAAPTAQQLAATKAVTDAIDKIIIAGQKAPQIMPAYRELEAVLNASHKVIVEVSQERHKATNYANGKPMPFICDYDVAPAKLILGNTAVLNRSIVDSSRGASVVAGSGECIVLATSASRDPSHDANSAAAWSTLVTRLTNFVEVAGMSASLTSAAVVASGFDLSALQHINVPEIFRTVSSSESGGGNSAATATSAILIRDGGISDNLLSGLLSKPQNDILVAQHEPLRKELETLEYNFGVAKTRLVRDLNEQTPALNSTDMNAQMNARHITNNARSLLIACATHLVDYHCRIGRFNEANRYAEMVEAEGRNMDLQLRPATQGWSCPNAPATGLTAPAETNLTDDHYALLSPMKYPTMLAKVLIYHTFRTDFFNFITARRVRDALFIAQQVVKNGPMFGVSGGASSSAAPKPKGKVAEPTTPSELFAKAVHAYEVAYAASSNSRAMRLGVPLPRYGLPDKEDGGDNSALSAGSDAVPAALAYPTPTSPLPIAIDQLTFDGASKLTDFNMQTAFNVLCAPLYTTQDYTLLVIAEFYSYLYEVAKGTGKARYLTDAAAYTNKNIVDERRKLHYNSMASLRKLRVEELTSAQYDSVKTLMFGGFRSQCIRRAQLATLAGMRAQQQQQQASSANFEGDGEGDDANGMMLASPSSGNMASGSNFNEKEVSEVAISYSDNTPVLCEIARVSAVLALSCLTRDEVKANYLGLPEVQALLSVEAEFVQDEVERLSACNTISQVGAASVVVLTNPTTFAKISTAARAVVQGCYNTNYADAMVGLTAAPMSILGSYFTAHPMLTALIAHSKQDIRESIIKRLLQPYATISISRIAEQLSMGPTAVGNNSADDDNTAVGGAAAATVAQLLEELKAMILHGKLGPSVRIDWHNKAIVRLQRSYGNTARRKAAKGAVGSNNGGTAAPAAKLDEAILLVAERLQSEVGAAHTRASERVIRLASLRATRMDDVPLVARRKKGGAMGGGGGGSGVIMGADDNDEAEW